MQSCTFCKAEILQSNNGQIIVVYSIKENTFGKIRGLIESVMQEWTENIPTEMPTFQKRIAVYG